MAAEKHLRFDRITYECRRGEVVVEGTTISGLRAVRYKQYAVIRILNSRDCIIIVAFRNTARRLGLQQLVSAPFGPRRAVLSRCLRRQQCERLFSRGDYTLALCLRTGLFESPSTMARAAVGVSPNTYTRTNIANKTLWVPLAHLVPYTDRHQLNGDPFAKESTYSSFPHYRYLSLTFRRFDAVSASITSNDRPYCYIVLSLIVYNIIIIIITTPIDPFYL